jgi:hypothetical protein
VQEGDDDARSPADPEERAEQRHREGRHENDRQRRQEGLPAGARLLCPAAREMPVQAIYPVDKSQADGKPDHEPEPLPRRDPGDRGFGPGRQAQHPADRHDALQSNRGAQIGIVNRRGAARAQFVIDIAQFGCRAGLVRQFLDAFVKFREAIHGSGGDEIHSGARSVLDKRNVDLGFRQPPPLARQTRGRIPVGDALERRKLDPVEYLLQLDRPLGGDGLLEHRGNIGKVQDPDRLCCGREDLDLSAPFVGSRVQSLRRRVFLQNVLHAAVDPVHRRDEILQCLSGAGGIDRAQRIDLCSLRRVRESKHPPDQQSCAQPFGAVEDKDHRRSPNLFDLLHLPAIVAVLLTGMPRNPLSRWFRQVSNSILPRGGRHPAMTLRLAPCR